ncbi:hypothetical protein BK004_04785 [bacterium CG10_46_32]|nr:MAG: hypothetical protein BK004_04785 [bacterium CG10_46_32]
MKVRIKRVDQSLPLPQYETSGAVAFDFVVREDTVMPVKGFGRIPSNVIIEIPKGYMVWVTDRSSTLKKTGLLISEGIIDQDYCGDSDEILLQFYNPTDAAVVVKRGDRIAQGIFLPVGLGEWEEVASMVHASRGGFGSTDSAPVASIPQQTIPSGQRGKFIVIDGIDGSGKGTQTDLLIKRLRGVGRTVAKADFPQYGNRSAGLVENYLNGKYGADVNPYIASFFYMLDRYDASFAMRESLTQGQVVVSNRYVSANMGHQGAKFKDAQKRQGYFSWLDQYEYGVFGIPRPDITLVLHVPARVAQGLVAQKVAREYTSKSHDLFEADLAHLEAAEQTYLSICKQFENFKLIECAPDGRILPIEKIHELIWEQVINII